MTFLYIKSSFNKIFRFFNTGDLYILVLVYKESKDFCDMIIV